MDPNPSSAGKASNSLSSSSGVLKRSSGGNMDQAAGGRLPPRGQGASTAGSSGHHQHSPPGDSGKTCAPRGDDSDGRLIQTRSQLRHGSTVAEYSSGATETEDMTKDKSRMFKPSAPTTSSSPSSSSKSGGTFYWSIDRDKKGGFPGGTSSFCSKLPLSSLLAGPRESSQCFSATKSPGSFRMRDGKFFHMDLTKYRHWLAVYPVFTRLSIDYDGSSSKDDFRANGPPPSISGSASTTSFVTKIVIHDDDTVTVEKELAVDSPVIDARRSTTADQSSAADMALTKSPNVSPGSSPGRYLKRRKSKSFGKRSMSPPFNRIREAVDQALVSRAPRYRSGIAQESGGRTKISLPKKLALLSSGKKSTDQSVAAEGVRGLTGGYNDSEASSNYVEGRLISISGTQNGIRNGMGGRSNCTSVNSKHLDINYDGLPVSGARSHVEFDRIMPDNKDAQHLMQSGESSMLTGKDPSRYVRIVTIRNEDGQPEIVYGARNRRGVEGYATYGPHLFRRGYNPSNFDPGLFNRNFARLPAYGRCAPNPLSAQATQGGHRRWSYTGNGTIWKAATIPFAVNKRTQTAQEVTGDSNGLKKERMVRQRLGLPFFGGGCLERELVTVDLKTLALKRGNIRGLRRSPEVGLESQGNSQRGMIRDDYNNVPYVDFALSSAQQRRAVFSSRSAAAYWYTLDGADGFATGEESSISNYSNQHRCSIL